MTMTAHDLALRLEAAVLATPGVRSVYRAGSLVANLVDAGAVALGARSAADPVVSVGETDDGARVEASIGIEYSAPALDTLHAVRIAIEAVLVSAGMQAAGVVITIAYVHPREAS